MIVLRAAEMGMCFGVRDALALLDRVSEPSEVTIHGELVHNPLVLRQLARRGFRSEPEVGRALPDTPAVLVTAHGVSDRERARIAAAGKRLIDTTCPLVRKAHDAARELAAEGRRLVVLGKPGHVEVEGLVGDHPGAVVVESAADVRGFGASRLGVMCQTTLPEQRAADLLARVVAANPAADVRFVDTICAPTKARQRALAELLDRVELLVVVGGRNSNNTRKLAATAAARGVPAMHVEGADDLDFEVLRGHAVVGLTAGTSTLPATVDAVEAAIRAFAAAEKVS
ncbi:MAG: 4-hydroxy-3-methylbut-2-enyl diphosphate reductase [Planctomycetes bacterium]|nr:4-hydroxy-3-methylbut-2-enyl diphosphate reductase [Planctomycetota bacterium]MCB9885864.1 4-hydroxy-3-methylbut-2-enyl diphosphate reductase [Planctomycetota bacterium]